MWLFATVPLEALELLAASFVTRHLTHGEVIFSEGADADCFYLLLAGNVEESVHGGGGDEAGGGGGRGSVDRSLGSIGTEQGCTRCRI